MQKMWLPERSCFKTQFMVIDSMKWKKKKHRVWITIMQMTRHCLLGEQEWKTE